MSGPSVGKEERSRLALQTTLNVLRRKDSTVTGIVVSSSHVAMYALNGGAWERMEIEGPLHIISRTSTPQHKLVVLNRKGMEDLSEDLQPGAMQLEIADAMIMYKIRRGDVRGIWFYQASDRDSVVQSLQKILQIQSVPHTHANSTYKDQSTATTTEAEITHDSARYSSQNATQIEGKKEETNADSASLERFFPGLSVQQPMPQQTVAQSPPRHVYDPALQSSPLRAPHAASDYLMGLLNQNSPAGAVPMPLSSAAPIENGYPGMESTGQPSAAIMNGGHELAQLLVQRDKLTKATRKMTAGEMKSLLTALLSDPGAFNAMYTDYLQMQQF